MSIQVYLGIIAIGVFIIAVRLKSISGKNKTLEAETLQSKPIDFSNSGVLPSEWIVRIVGIAFTQIHEGKKHNSQKIVSNLMQGDMLRIEADINGIPNQTEIKVLTNDNRQIGWYPSGHPTTQRLFKRLIDEKPVNVCVHATGRTQYERVWWCEIKVAIDEPAFETEFTQVVTLSQESNEDDINSQTPKSAGERLKQINELKESGLISEEEYQEKRKEILFEL